MVIAEKDFYKIIRRIFDQKIVEGSMAEDPWIYKYKYFRNCALEYNLNIDEQILIISASIRESEGFQHLIEADPIKRPDETDTEYEDRCIYKGRGYIRLSGKENYKAAYEDLKHLRPGNFFVLPYLLEVSIKRSWLVSFWIWDKKIRPVIRRKRSLIDKMIALTEALHPNVTTESLNLSLDILKTTQECVKEKQDQLIEEQKEKEEFLVKKEKKE
eukprot:GHVP01023609.1.p1 GENE.GHVP01023609.1~~GHVP01023609.1.p1  ORF type:complete len:215 (+),score=39.06 GHVP01023609.1:43-687(+)